MIFAEKLKYGKTKEFIVSKDVNLDFYSFNNQTDFYASAISKKFDWKNIHIAVFCENTPQFVSLIITLWKIGAIPVLIGSRNKKEEIDLLMKKTKCTFLLTNSTQSSYPNFKFSAFLSAELHIPANLYININNINLILFTSGTSSTPKAVQHSFASLEHSLLNSDSFIKHDSNNTWLLSLPVESMGGFSILLRSIYFNTRLLFPENLYSDVIVNNIIETKPEYVSFVPTQIKKIISSGIKTLPVKYIFLGGDKSDSNLLEECIALDLPVVKVYGSSETASMVTALPREELKYNPESSGYALNDVRIYINEFLYTDNDAGEIEISTGALFHSYFDDDKLTAEKIKNDRYKTGDLGYLKENKLSVLSRKEQFIISGGLNVSPSEIENVINKYHEVFLCAVIGIPSSYWGEEIVAVIQPKFELDLNVFALKQYLNEKLAGYKIPKRFILTDSIPLTSSGKIDYKKLSSMV